MAGIRIGAYFAGTCLVAIAAAITPAAAQVNASAPAAADPTTAAPTGQVPPVAEQATGNLGAGDIIVTAQRRSESLSRTPVSVSVLSLDTLTKRAVTTEADLPSVAPGLTVRATANSNALNYSIRGQSLDAFSGTRPGVLPYVDEVQVGGGGGATAFYDLQSIQVLKGPQGTLFGRNATGGAVLFTTAKPTNTFGGYVLGRVGNYNLGQVEGALNIPIVSDVVLARVAGFYEKRDGFQRDVYQNVRAGDVDRYGIRGSLTLKPSADIRNDLVVDYFEARGSSLVGVLYGLNPNGAIPLIALTNFGNAPQFEAIISGFVTGAGGPPNAGAGAAAAYAAANPKLDPGGLATTLARQRSRGPFVVESNTPNEYRGDNLIISNITAIDIGANTQIRNVLGYTRINSRNRSDFDGTAYGIDDNANVTNRAEQFSEELQIIGKTFANRLSYVTGVYYASEKTLYLNPAKILTFPIIASLQSFAAQNRNKTYAGYAQGTYALGEAIGQGLSVTAGIRYTSEKVGFTTLPADNAFLDPAAVRATYDFDQSKVFKNLSWTLGVQDQVSSSLLLYAASRRSYRNGGYNNSQRPVPGLGTQGGNGYGRETVTDAEIGAKYSGRVGLTPVRASIALYQDWIRDSQRVAYTLIAGSPAAVTVNVPRAIVRGVELEGSISPASWLQIGGAAAYTDAKFTSDQVSIQGSAPVRFGTYPDTPELSGSAFAELTVPVSSALAATLRSDVYAQTHTFFTSSGNTNPTAKLPGYALVNFRVGIEDTRSGWSLTANVKNAFNRTYYVGGIALGELFQLNTAVPGAPRTAFVEARYKF